MIRMYRRDAQLLLILLICFKEEGGDFNALLDRADALTRQDGRTGVGWQEVVWALRNDELSGTTLDELIDVLASAVRDHRHGVKGDANLVDAIVDVIQLPFSRNILAGRNMQDLRRAVLVPSEAVGLADRLKKKETQCASCGHIFQHRELVVPASDSASQVLYCFRCLEPDYVSCQHSGCNNVVPVGKVYVRKNASKGGADCGYHKEGEASGAAGPDPGQIAAAVRNRLRPRAALQDFLHPARLDAPQPVWGADDGDGGL
jgi:hypothetical protein